MHLASHPLPIARYSPQHNRILMVTEALARGGAERQMIALIDGLLLEGYEVEVLELQGVVADQPSFQDELALLGVKSRRAAEIALPIDGGLGSDADGLEPFASVLPPDIATICTALAAAIEEFRPRVVHCWSDLANLVGGFVSTKLAVPRVVLAQRTLPPPFWCDVLEASLYRKAYRMLAGHTAVSMLNNSAVSIREFARWIGLPNETIKLVYNGFLPSSMHIRKPHERGACRVQLGLPSSARVVGAVMRFAPEKDTDLWLETAAAIAAALPDVHFVLAGYGHDNIAEQIRRKGARLGLAHRLVMPGTVADVGLIYGALNVLLLASRAENVPNVMIEAQAAGVPVVGPDVGGIPEAMWDGVTGVLAGERSAEGLAAAALQVLSSPDWLESVAGNGPAFVALRFGQKRMVRETIAIYSATPRRGAMAAAA
jgi:glycosyltransferase involved in cell wall biosynthesis